MKKLLISMLSAALILSLTLTSFTACTSTSTNETKVFKSLALLETDNYALDMHLIVDIRLYRQGDNLLFGFVETDVVIIDRKEMEFDHEAKIAYYTEVSNERYEEILEQFDAIRDTMIKLDGARLRGTGRGEFMNYGVLAYEEIIDANSDIVQIFFSDDGEMVGYAQENENGNINEVKFHISTNIPEGVFEIPDGYELVNKADRGETEEPHDDDIEDDNKEDTDEDKDTEDGDTDENE